MCRFSTEPYRKSAFLSAKQPNLLKNYPLKLFSLNQQAIKIKQLPKGKNIFLNTIKNRKTTSWNLKSITKTKRRRKRLSKLNNLKKKCEILKRASISLPKSGSSLILRNPLKSKKVNHSLSRISLSSKTLIPFNTLSQIQGKIPKPAVFMSRKKIPLLKYNLTQVRKH